MNSKTKIIVIHMKELVIGGAIFLVALIAAIAIIMSMMNKEQTPTNNNNVSKSDSTGIINAPQKETASTQNITQPNNSQPSETAPVQNTAINTLEHTYTPGVYTASVSLDGNPVDIQLTVDKHNINSIELIHVTDAVTTMYPLIQTNFENIASLVIQSGSTENITFNSDNKYTSDLLLNAIQKALDKCTVESE